MPRALLPWISAVTLAAAPLARAQQGVSLPVLKTTYPASWDESWFGSPAVYDLDGDGAPEIILYSNHEKAGDTAQYGNCLWALRGGMTRAKGFETPFCSDAPLFTGSYNNVVQTVAAAAVGNLSGDTPPRKSWSTPSPAPSAATATKARPSGSTPMTSPASPGSWLRSP